MKTKRDPRGLVAVVYASDDGPAVHFVGRDGERTHAENLIAALRATARIWGESDGKTTYSWPTAIFVQQRAGHWSHA